MLERVAVAVLLSIVVSAGAGAQAPIPVSPGSQEGIVIVSGRCPTFHWAGVEGASSVDLAVFRLAEGERGAPIEKLLSLTLPGSASGWTPPMAQCLEPAGRYAWSVGTGGEWSEASFFEVSAGPTLAEIEEALALVRRAGGVAERARREERDLGGLPYPDTRQSSQPLVADPPVAHEMPELPTDTVFHSTAPGLSATPALTIDGQLHLGEDADFFRDGVAFLWTDADSTDSSGSVALGIAALRDSTGSNNTAVGHTALRANTTGSRNTAVGEDALLQNATGSDNSAFGEDALVLNADGFGNSAFGANALYLNIGGWENSALGFNALRYNSSGHGNSALGHEALHSNLSGQRNEAVGRRALESSTSGSFNTAVGTRALARMESGTGNIGIGYKAGFYVEGDASENIFIGNVGEYDDSNTMRIGTFTQHRTFIDGIRGKITGQNDAITVRVDSEGQLGTTSSSREVKQDIREIGGLSRRLLELQPVAFRYRQHVATSPETPVQFGLIAEDVAEVFPELVVYDNNNRPTSIKYHLLSSLLLNELQRQHRQLRLLILLAGTSLLVTAALRWIGPRKGRGDPA
jgi:hypothetical protein